MSRGSHLSGGIDVSLCNERVERDGQQHHAQQNCAPRGSGEATYPCSLFLRQQWSNQRSNAVHVRPVLYHTAVRNEIRGPNAPAECNWRTDEQDLCKAEAPPGTSAPQNRGIEVARPLQCINHRVTPSLDFDAARSLIVTPSRCWAGRRRSFIPGASHERPRS